MEGGIAGWPMLDGQEDHSPPLSRALRLTTLGIGPCSGAGQSAGLVPAFSVCVCVRAFVSSD